MEQNILREEQEDDTMMMDPRPSPPNWSLQQFITETNSDSIQDGHHALTVPPELPAISSNCKNIQQKDSTSTHPSFLEREDGPTNIERGTGSLQDEQRQQHETNAQQQQERHTTSDLLLTLDDDSKRLSAQESLFDHYQRQQQQQQLQQQQQANQKEQWGGQQRREQYQQQLPTATIVIPASLSSIKQPQKHQNIFFSPHIPSLRNNQQEHQQSHQEGTEYYRDFSLMPDPAPDNRRNRGGVTVPFPEKLHTMLEYAEKNGLTDVVSFFPHGRAFAIHKPLIFVSDIMPKFFKQSRFTSFQRQVNLYRFRRISQGPDTGGYFHELFLKGRPGLCINMKRTKVKGSTKGKSNPETEPNFYNMPPILGSEAAASNTSSAGIYSSAILTNIADSKERMPPLIAAAGNSENTKPPNDSSNHGSLLGKERGDRTSNVDVLNRDNSSHPETMGDINRDLSSSYHHQHPPISFSSSSSMPQSTTAERMMGFNQTYLPPYSAATADMSNFPTNASLTTTTLSNQHPLHSQRGEVLGMSSLVPSSSMASSSWPAAYQLPSQSIPGHQSSQMTRGPQPLATTGNSSQRVVKSSPASYSATAGARVDMMVQGGAPSSSLSPTSKDFMNRSFQTTTASSFDDGKSPTKSQKFRTGNSGMSPATTSTTNVGDTGDGINTSASTSRKGTLQGQHPAPFSANHQRQRQKLFLNLGQNTSTNSMALSLTPNTDGTAMGTWPMLNFSQISGQPVASPSMPQSLIENTYSMGMTTPTMQGMNDSIRSQPSSIATDMNQSSTTAGSISRTDRQAAFLRQSVTNFFPSEQHEGGSHSFSARDILSNNTGHEIKHPGNFFTTNPYLLPAEGGNTNSNLTLVRQQNHTEQQKKQIGEQGRPPVASPQIMENQDDNTIPNTNIRGDGDNPLEGNTENTYSFS